MSLQSRARGLAFLAFPALATVAFAQGVDIWTVGVNNTRQGWNRLETALTAANVPKLKKIREFADAIGDPNPVYRDPEAAQAYGHRDVMAPPTFPIIITWPAALLIIEDPKFGLDFARLLHSAQEFRWGPLDVSGDEIETTMTVKDISARGEMGFYTFESVSTNQDGDTVCVGTWSNIVRGGEG